MESGEKRRMFGYVRCGDWDESALRRKWERD